MPATTATTTAIPLTTFSQTQTANTIPSSSLQTTTAPSANHSATTTIQPTPLQPPSLPRYANRPPTWSEKLANSFSFANGLSTMALLAAFIFGIGAWVGMKVQISQGGKSMELAIWTTCADHAIIQNSTLCQSIMAKDFSELASRDLLPGESPHAVAVVVKRDLSSDEVLLPQSHYSKFISTLSPSDRSLVEAKDNRYNTAESNLIKASVFPLVSLLVRPLTWIFDFLESILLLTVFCLHKLLSWCTWILLFILQAIIYNTLESLLNQCLHQLDAAIYASLPSWTPYLLASNLASWVGLSGLRSFWYGTNFLQSLKWIFIFRLAMWAVVEGCKGAFVLWAKWREIVEERRRMRSVVPDPFGTAESGDWVKDCGQDLNLFYDGVRRR